MAAIAAEITFHGPGLTIQKYFDSLPLLNAVPEGPHPDPSCLFHWARAEANGYVVTDVWKNRAAFDTFVHDKIGPVTAQLNIPAPHIKFIEVANYLT